MEDWEGGSGGVVLPEVVEVDLGVDVMVDDGLIFYLIRRILHVQQLGPLAVYFRVTGHHAR